MNRTDRLYALVEELRAVAPRPRSARQLAWKYEVSTRTIERDVLALQDAGVPVYAESGRRGGYVIDKALTLPPVNFTAAEMVAIAVSLAGAEGTPFAFAARSALRKVAAAAPAGQLAEAAQLMDRIRLIGTGQPARSGARPLSAAGPDATGDAPATGMGVAAKPATGQARTTVPLAIQEAITARHVLLIDYRDRHDVVTVREVEPVAFAGTQAHWYLLAWCRLRESARPSGWTGSSPPQTPASRRRTARMPTSAWTSRTRSSAFPILRAESGRKHRQGVVAGARQCWLRHVAHRRRNSCPLPPPTR